MADDAEVNNVPPQPGTDQNPKSVRTIVDVLICCISLGFAMFSLVAGIRHAAGHHVPTRVAATIVGIWVLAPPVYFWIDWVFLVPRSKANPEIVKHTHDLARNIWLALIVTLVALFGLQWKPF